jgi:hypothetical protein
MLAEDWIPRGLHNPGSKAPWKPEQNIVAAANDVNRKEAAKVIRMTRNAPPVLEADLPV